VNIDWLHYTDHDLAPLGRSQGGSIKAIIEWLHISGHQQTLLREIDYSAERLNIALNESDTGRELNEDSMQKLLFTKFEHWAYEEEYRVYIRLEEQDAASNLYFKNFDNNLVLQEVIVGPMCDTTYNDVISILGASTRVKITEL